MKASLIKEEKYWSVIDQTGQIKEMPLNIGSPNSNEEMDSSIIFQS